MSAIVSEFEYVKPKDLKETLELLSKHDSYALLAGGTDLVCSLKENLLSPKIIIDIKNLSELKKINLSGDVLELGALVTFTELIESPLMRESFPLLVESSMTVASGSVRNRATMVGNICSAVPCMDSGAPLMVYEGEMVIRSLKGERVVAMKDWFISPRKTALQKGELVTAVRLKKFALKQGSVYVKLGRYTGEDLAQASVAVLALANNDYRISFGSLAPVPVRAMKIENLLRGKELTSDLISEAKKLVASEISPITDLRATKEYRQHMAEVMLERALVASVERLKGQGPKLGTSLI